MDGLISRAEAIELIESTTWYDPRDTDVAHEMIGALPSVQSEDICDTCKHGYFGDEQCDNCRVRFTSHYERRTDDDRNG